MNYGMHTEALNQTHIAKACEAVVIKDQIVPIAIEGKQTAKAILISKDEEYQNIKLDKVKSLRPVFTQENGAVIVANTSTLNNGANAVVLMIHDEAGLMGVQKLARIIF
ncbi:hypothetical protein H4Q26_008376 [Puccinia striiformis f. sp. tritici PST-130]|uniref:Thiolase N-terminal domain-containing protein n=1 Tax=Puccinia striiformis f. sp. tritici PST-78 TaxID=1165861 RepID=A0A0L0UXC3_9BASI|nr:hypothetical protein H4Q26_008376 [Puccinia striiformis f. sp. tritici PST-130]KNE91576.1 hypothetical protein PSTG_15028 [Puccinia striiformis f. sp. tritici PST-78]